MVFEKKELITSVERLRQLLGEAISVRDFARQHDMLGIHEGAIAKIEALYTAISVLERDLKALEPAKPL